MRKIYLLPNLFTTASLFCGGFAIFNVLEVSATMPDEHWRYELSCWLILISAILDSLDGLIARMTRTQSAFGGEYDSLSDLVAFGVAPAVLIYSRLVNANIQQRHLADIICTLFIACGALRLARFNVQKTGSEKKSFTGLPIPAAAGTMVAGFLCFQRIDPEWTNKWILWILPMLMITLSYLMVSNISYPSLKQLNLEGRMKFNVLPVIVLIATICIALKNQIPAFIFIGLLIYIGVGIGGAVRRQRKQRLYRKQYSRIKTAAKVNVPNAVSAENKDANEQ